MTVEVPRHIHTRLVGVINDLRNAVGQKAAVAVLASFTNVEPVECVPDAAVCDDSWMEFINENFVTNASPSNPAPSSPPGKTKDPCQPRTDSQTEEPDTGCSAPSPQTTYLVSSDTTTVKERCEHCLGSTIRPRRGKSYNPSLEMVVQSLPRSDLLECLETHWQALTGDGIYAMPSSEVCTWTVERSSEQIRRLQYHLILRYLDVEDDLHQWRRSIAERRNLGGYNAFLAEAQAEQRIEKRTRRSGERSSSKAHTEYLAHIYADRTPKDYKRAKQGLQKDLRHGRRWSILIDGFVTDDGDVIPGLGVGFLLLCGPATARKMLYARLLERIC